MVKKRISIEDVARRAGVSITTVSRVINNVPTVSKQNRIKVEEAVAHLKFKPNLAAQRLASGLNNSVGLVMPGYPGLFHSFYAIELIRGVGHACETLHLDLVFHISDGNSPVNTNAMGGVIFADIIENKKQVQEVLEEGVPCIVINNIVEDLDVNYIAVDNIKGAKIATEYLVGLGHKRIATITGNVNTQAGAHRLDGFKETLEKKGITLRDEYIYKGDYSRRCARSAVEEFLSLKNPPTAIFAASDDMALEAIEVVMEKRLKVPQDISIIGFDDNPSALYGPIGLTTIRQPLFKMAEEAVRYLNAIVAGKKTTPAKIILSPDLVTRESCSGPKH
ncbi:MAG TPA: LacI family DNA-binding transcriptional regulator [Candidatus Omnitrophota bacterium]|nr:LacI family DNA-binding transcriptional regulator [Candidatus Omnitrophota bacterium]HPD84650.1 LacI family DNA-binding transcriptional regulator [Candidatus Omnitrophota bacterium]HRZ03508.1 LacI family DNA-binding transcriptional regulator [Candidatus Omnitrophota bacterium]